MKAMSRNPLATRLALLGGLAFAACSGSTSPAVSGGGGSGTGATGTGSATGTGNSTGGGNSNGTGNATGTGAAPGAGGGGVVYPPGGPAPTAVPIRRLTNDEYTQSVMDLFSRQVQADGTVYAGFTVPAPAFILDTRVFGFVNLSSSQTASQVRMEQYEGAAQMIALGDGLTPQVWTGVAANPTTLTGCDAAVKSELLCAQPYLYNLAKRAYRRALSATEKTALWALFLNPAGGTYPQRLALAIEGILISPNFIFRPELGDATKVVSPGVLALTPWEMANRLSFFINGSMPDAALTAAADSGALANVSEVRAQAQRLLALPQSQKTLVKMHEEWLGIDTINALTKNTSAFPDFTSTLAFEMGLETRTFIQNIMFTQGGTFNDLLLAPYTFGNADIAKIYGVPAAAGDPNAFSKLALDPTQRLGLLTQPSLMATLAKDSPVQDLGTAIRRGKFVLQQVLCRSVPEPTQAIVAMFQPLDLTATTRAQATTHEFNAACRACHAALDPLGLPFEKYDMVGQWREMDKKVPIDVSGQILDAAGNANAFNGVPALAKLVAQMPESRACYLQQWFQFSTGKLVAAPDQPFLDWLTASFTPTQKLVDLVVNLVTSDSFRQMKVVP
jgi:Protein of unknown function (DUF1592)/Protein of unknown function (DUF1588)/Protein of unknown function (DUF1595)/Protein of unknown function (DUF1587)/Protein of unknown function (DUF1585)